MIKPTKLFSQIATKNNVLGFSDAIQLAFDRISQKMMKTVIIYVSKKVPLSQLSKKDTIPRYHTFLFRRPLRFKVKEIGVITAPPAPTQKVLNVDRTKRQDPVTLGLSVAHRSISAGSLGMFFTEQESNNVFGGSNAHVLTPDASLSPDQIDEKRIHQPGSYHQEPTQGTMVGTYHWHKQVVSGMSECPIAGLTVKSLNGFSNLFRRNTKMQAITAQAKNKIDFACYKATAPHACKLPDGLKFPGPFVGLLFAGSEQVGIISKSGNISAEGYQSTEPEGEVNVGDRVFGSSFWGDYETVVEDVSASIQIQYGSFIAVFEDLIMVKNEGIIKGGWSGSGFFRVEK